MPHMPWRNRLLSFNSGVCCLESYTVVRWVGAPVEIRRVETVACPGRWDPGRITVSRFAFSGFGPELFIALVWGFRGCGRDLPF